MHDVRYVILACYPDKGMKSAGSKGLLYFDQKRLLEFQISSIKKNHKSKKITVIVEFDHQRVQKAINEIDPKIDVIVSENQSPISIACSKHPQENLCFIDYGCVFNKSLIDQLTFKTSEIVCVKDSSHHNNLDVGCTIDNGYIQHMFLDLPKNKFSNIFAINKTDSQKINSNKVFQKHNLLYFEILNLLIYYESLLKPIFINDHFIFFNHMRQKNAINKFVKKNS